MYAVLLDNRSCAEQVDAAASGYNAGAGAAASWTLIKVLNMCMIVLGRSHGVISSRSPAGRHEPGAQRQVRAPGSVATAPRPQRKMSENRPIEKFAHLFSCGFIFRPLCSLILAVYSLCFNKMRQPHTMWDLSNSKEFT